MANSKIQQIKLSDTVYDIDLPSTATPTVNYIRTNYVYDIDDESPLYISSGTTTTFLYSGYSGGTTYIDVPHNKGTASSHDTFATLSDLTGYATTASLSNYAKASDLANYVTSSTLTSTLSGYVKLADSQTISGSKTFSAVTYFTKGVYHNGGVTNMNYASTSSTAPTLYLTDNNQYSSATTNYFLSIKQNQKVAGTLSATTQKISTLYAPEGMLTLYYYTQSTSSSTSLDNGYVKYTGHNIVYNPPDSSSTYTFSFPSSSGTFALTSQIPTIPTTATNTSNVSSAGNAGLLSLYGYSSSTYAYANLVNAAKAIFIRTGSFTNSSSTSGQNVSFSSSMRAYTPAGSLVTASLVKVILEDGPNMASGQYMNSHAITSASYTGFTYKSSNSETGTVHYIAIGI